MKMAGEASSIKSNFQKILVSVLAICGICIGEGDPQSVSQVKKAIIKGFYASFKGQVVLADTFRKAFGRLQRGKIVSSTQETLQACQEAATSETMVESQLTFLRSATAMSLSIDALVLCLTKPLTTYDCVDAM